MAPITTVAVAQLNQWVLDWEGNAERIIEAVRIAKFKKARLVIAPELAISSYGCLDHFLEGDIHHHSMDMLHKILKHPNCQGIMIDLGAAVRHNSVLYNCRIIALSKRLLLIRPKMSLANSGNHREMRYFAAWSRPRQTEKYILDDVLHDLDGQETVDFGDAIIDLQDTSIGFETCEEMFLPDRQSAHSGLDGAEIFSNSSASHCELRKLDKRVDLMKNSTKVGGGCYLYSNLGGCDGDRLYYDGASMILLNGEILAMAPQYSLDDVVVITATIDLDAIRRSRSEPSRVSQAVAQERYPRIKVLNYSMRHRNVLPGDHPMTFSIQPVFHKPEAEIELSGACWLWNYLRRSGAAGFALALSGGIDSCATALLVYSMCRQVIKAAGQKNEQVIKDCRRICALKDGEELPATPEALCNKIFCTTYMGTEKASSKETRQRAKDLSARTGAYHVDLNIDKIVSALTTVVTTALSFTPRFKTDGGTAAESLALQNIQARLRMVLIYFLAQIVPTVRKRQGGGALLVVTSANVDEALYGYYTKYDCSSGDLNPIGGISKTDLKRFIAHARDDWQFGGLLQSFLDATPTAELEPITSNYVQSDEADMGLTYDQLSDLGRLRKVEKLGIYSTWEWLVSASQDTTTAAGQLWRGMSPPDIWDKVKIFYGANFRARHKQAILTPALHLEQYSPDDHRFDHRPLFLPPVWSSYPAKLVKETLVKMGYGEDGNRDS